MVHPKLTNQSLLNILLVYHLGQSYLLEPTTANWQSISKLLSPYIPQEYYTKDSFMLWQKIKKAKTKGKFSISYGFCSLFTSMPLITHD